MAETKVSDAFEEFYNKEQEAIEKVKHEEARTSDLPVDIGDSGICVVTDMSFDKTPNKLNDKQEIIKKGCPVARVGFRIIDHPTNQGKRLQQSWFFWQNENTTQADNFKRFLDDLENKFGLPREVRENHKHPKELGDWFQNNQHTIAYKVVEDKPNDYNDGKKLVLSQPKDIVPETADVLPPSREKKTEATASADTFSKGEVVEYMGDQVVIVDVYNLKVQVKGVDDPSFEKVVLKTDLKKLS